MVRIRPARPEDARALLDVYAYYVTDTAVSFEYEVPTLEEFRGRMEHIMVAYPWLVAEEDGIILGYAYAHPFIPRAAYDHCAEMTVYLDRNCRGRGVGARLYEALEDILRRQDVRDVYACIGVPRTDDDPYLSHASPRFHGRMGYTLAGNFPCSGYKFDRWYDMVWMGKTLGAHDGPPRFRPWTEVGAW